MLALFAYVILGPLAYYLYLWLLAQNINADPLYFGLGPEVYRRFVCCVPYFVKLAAIYAFTAAYPYQAPWQLALGLGLNYAMLRHYTHVQARRWALLFDFPPDMEAILPGVIWRHIVRWPAYSVFALIEWYAIRHGYTVNQRVWFRLRD